MNPANAMHLRESTTRMNGKTAQAAEMWIISSNSSRAERLRELARQSSHSAQLIDPRGVDTRAFWSGHAPAAPLIVLDVDGDLDWGVEVIRSFKRARVRAALIVLTREISREFGAKIVSQGIRYYFPHDFCKSEFLEVVDNLLKHQA